MINNTTIEICIGNINDLRTLEKYDIDRIELNSALELGGLTPSISTLLEARKLTIKYLACMCRCRGGNFCYGELEYQVMFNDAKTMLENGADGIVFGFLNEDNCLNIEKTKMMIDLIHSYNKEAIFHRASDDCADIDILVNQLNKLGIDRILTSGKSKYPNILDGCTKIKELASKYPKISFLPGGGVRIDNVVEVLKLTNAKQIHMTSKKQCSDGHYVLDEEQLIQMLKEIKRK